MLESVLKFAGKRKMRMGSRFLKVAACFVDYESEHLPPDSRIVEDSFVFSKLIGYTKKGNALDVGCIARHNYISPSLAMNGWNVYGIDIRNEWEFHHPNFHFVQQDIRHSDFKDDFFDLITCVSTLEHIGLLGYYGNQTKVDDGDAETMKELKRILKPDGTLLLTVPFCDNYSERAGVRVYDYGRLLDIMDGMAAKDSLIYCQNKKGDWKLTTSTSIEGVICLELVKI